MEINVKSKLKKEKQKEIAEKETDLCCAAKKKSNQIILKKKGKRKKRLYGRNRKKKFTVPFPSLYRPGVQSCCIPSKHTVPGSQSKQFSGQN